MFKRNYFFIMLGLVLVFTSAVLYFVHYLIFHDVHHIFIYMVGDLAFLPLEVLLVGIIVERALSAREKNSKMQKLNMVVGAFFSEAGNQLLSSLLESFKNREEICAHLNLNAGWTRKDFQKAAQYADQLPAEIDYSKLDLLKLKNFLEDKRDFFLNLLGNPSLLEHDKFTDLLWAATHVDEELSARTSFEGLPESDIAHVGNDVRRMYDDLASEWVDYAEHLKNRYPYLFSLLVRTHPFQAAPSPVVKG